MPLPGDDLIAAPWLQTTHAITIDAAPAAVWPWLVQIGAGRAGFYSDKSWWDACVSFYYRLLAREQHTVAEGYQHDGTRIVPQWQTLHVGDAILDGPPGTAHYVVRARDAPRTLVLFTSTHLPHLLPARLRSRVTGELSDAFVLVPTGHAQTRVLRRMRVSCRPLAFGLLALPIVLVWGELITARNFLRGLKRRAEQSQRERS